MGSIRLPQAQLSEIQQPSKRKDQSDLIMQVLGTNPLAGSIDSIGTDIAGALEKRAQTRKQVQQVAQLEALGGENPGAYKGLDPMQASSFAAASRKNKSDIQEEARKMTASVLKVRALEKQFGYAENELGDDHPSALMKVQNDLMLKRQKEAVTSKKKQVGVTSNGVSVTYNPSTERNETPDGNEYTEIIYPVSVGPAQQRSEALVETGKSAITRVRELLTPSVLQELKAIRLSPGKAYSQLSSPQAKKVYINLKRAMENETYLRTGAAANEYELENSVVANMAALNDNPADFLGRMDYLDESISNFSTRGSRGPELKKIKESPGDQRARLLKELTVAR